MKQLHGIIPPVITPLTPKGELDPAGLERLLEHIIAGGVHEAIGRRQQQPERPADMTHGINERIGEPGQSRHGNHPSKALRHNAYRITV